MRRDLLWLFAVALAVRAVAAWLVDYPPYTDPANYLLVGERLAHGQGFTTPVLWSFLDVGARLPADPVLPIPSNAHWMPMAAILAAAGIWPLEWLLGTWHAAQVPFVLLSAALVPLTYLVSRELWPSRRVALAAAVLVLFAGPFLVYLPQVSSMAPFGAFGAGALWCSMRSLRSATPVLWLLAAGLFTGLATLTRIDGVLLAVAPLVAWWVVVPRPRFAALVGAAAVFGVVLAPWLLRNMAVFGSPLPSTGGHTLWLTSYNQQFSIGSDVSLGSYLAWGPVNIIGSKFVAWAQLAGRTSVLLGGFFVLPFVFGLWAERRRRELAPFIAYFAVMFFVMGAVFTFHAPFGAFYHSAAAWLPFALPLAVASTPGFATAVGRWWRFLARERTQRFLQVVALGGALVLSLVGSGILVAQWTINRTRYVAAADFLAANAAPADRVMAYDPAILHVFTGLEGVAPPFDPYPVIGQVVDAYGVDWVVVIVGAGEGGDALDLVRGREGVDAEGNHPDFLQGSPAFTAPGVRIYRAGPGAPR